MARIIPWSQIESLREIAFKQQEVPESIEKPRQKVHNTPLSWTARIVQ